MSLIHLSGPVRLDAERVEPHAWVVGGRVTYVAPTSPVDLTVEGWVLPGLVDAHCHVGLGPTGAVDRDTAVSQALSDRDSGALLLRDAGSATETRWMDDDDAMPRIIRAGRHIARSRRYLRGVGEEIEPDALVAEVRRQVARGDGWIKLVGDWIDRDVGDLAPCWPREAVRAAIEAAHEAGARVTAHCFSAVSLPDLLDAGIDGIEHGTGFTSALAEQAAAAGVAVVPTLLQIETFPRLADQGEARFPAWAATMRDLHARRQETVEMLHATGVPLFAGTDAGTVHPHGRIAQEVALMAAVVGNEVAVGAACWDARRWLGRPGLDEGAPADLLVVAGDPLDDPRVLGDPRAVVLRGALVYRAVDA